MKNRIFCFGLAALLAMTLPSWSQPSPRNDVIYLNAGNVDTAAPQTQARAKAAVAAGKQLRLIQFDGPIQPAWVAELEKSGLRIVDYIPENTYLVYGDAPAVQSMQAKSAGKSHVRWEGAYRGIDKVHPIAAQSATAKPTKERPDPTLFSIQLVLDPAMNPATLALIDSLKLQPIVKQGPEDKYYNLIVSLPPGSIGKVSEQSDVISIQPYNTPGKRDERQCIIMTGQLTNNAPTGPGYMAWLANRGFTQAQFDASGLVVDVTDSPVGNGGTNENHFALYRDGTISNNSPARLVYSRLEGTPNSGSVISAQDGHGNINAHIIAGQVNLSGAPHADSSGYRYGLGVAPFVKVGGSIIFDTSRFTSPNYNNLAARAYRDGARVSGNSWGADTAGAYNSDAQNYDRLVRDAQPSGSAVATAGNQQMSFVFAAGNAGSGVSTVGSPGTAKNVITVGAAENVHPFGGSDGSGIADSGANSANDVISFSSRGPCSDQRKKPDLMAPGTHVTGGVPQAVKTMSGTGTKLAIFDGSGVSGGVNSIYFPSSGQQFYTASSGTSHSTPAVAGAAALVYQWFINKGWATVASPASPAMIKAYLMNAARYMTGVSANDTLYSNNQGMGMVNLDTSFDTTLRLLRDQRTEDIFTASGQSRTWTGQVATGAKPLRITLAWTDAPGSTTGNAYKNNLDLTVTVNGTVYRGNVFTGANSAAGGTADVRNNVESVFLPAGTTGAVTITVSGANINSDGVPNYGTTIDQDFALVAYNFTEVQAPAIVGAGSVLVAEDPGSVNNAIDPAEFVTVGFGLRNAGNLGTTNVTATLLETNGIIPVTSAPVSYGALAAGGTAVTRNFQFVANADCGSVVTAVLALQDGSTNLGTASFDFVLGTFSSVTATNTNSAAITIRDNNSATPYPSTINVAGRSGTVSKVTVTIPAFSHTYPGDVNIILVAPNGKKVALMGGVGGGTDAVSAALTFDDAASGPIGASVVAGTYQPSGSVSSMPAGAPTGPYASALSEFNGSPANGAWSLYVADAAATDSGSMAQGWRIAITTSQASCLGVNQAPVVSLTSPTNGSTVLAGQTVNLAATASDLTANGSAGVVSKVEFFEGSNLIATDTVDPYTATWTPPAAGSYTLSARATDSENLAGNSESVTIGVLSGDGSPTISSFTPTSGASLSPVVINGSNFSGVTAVRFNGVASTSYTVDSPTQITAVVPATATTGPISVVNSFGAATSAGVFTILQTPVLISQIYGGGGNSGAPYRNDYVELYNRSSVSVDVSSWTIQYASATGTTWQAAALTGSIAPGKYYLVQLGGGSVGSVLPTPDATGTIGMAATAGKVALRNSATAFTGGTPIGQAGLEDFVGYGTSASAFEGAGAAPAPSATQSIFRGGGGATDTGNNNTDFSAAAPNPRNSSTGTTVAPVITSSSTANATVGQSFSYQITASNSPTSFGATILPTNGLSLNASNGLISGTPLAAGTINLTISASNAAGAGTAPLAIVVASGGGEGGGELFREDFASITGGNSTTNTGSSTAWSGNSNFPTVATAYQAGGAVRLGASSAIGSITSRELDLSGNGGSFTVSYKVKGWTTVEGNIKVSVGSVSQTNTYTAVMAGDFEAKTLNFTGGTNNSTIKIETTSRRAFIDDVVVTSSAPATPTISTTGTLSSVSSVYGAASAAPASFNLSGTNMTAGILVTPPAGFEVSQTVGGASGYSSTQTVGAVGTISSTTVYVRLAAGTAAGTYSGNVTCSSTGATSATVAVPSSTVQQAPLSVTANDVTKAYGQTLTLGAGQTGFSSVGLIGAETIGSVTLASAGAPAEAAPGTYAITPSAATGGTFTAANYSVLYKGGVLTVTEPPVPTFESWMSSTYPQITGTDALPTADPDNDGIANLLEYYMGLRPDTADSSAVVISNNLSASPSSISMIYQRSKNITGVTGNVTWTSSLTNSNSWSTNGVTESVRDLGTADEVTATVTNALSETLKFLRLRVTQP
jgi:subtilisin-like proprotein convertase family protein